MRFDSTIFATEIDHDSLTVARRNIDSNLSDDFHTVELCAADAEERDLIGRKILDDNLQSGETCVSMVMPAPRAVCSPILSVNRIDFVMCNPPFYASTQEIEISARQKELEPFAVSSLGASGP